MLCHRSVAAADCQAIHLQRKYKLNRTYNSAPPSLKKEAQTDLSLAIRFQPKQTADLHGLRVDDSGTYEVLRVRVNSAQKLNAQPDQLNQNNPENVKRLKLLCYGTPDHLRLHLFQIHGLFTGKDLLTFLRRSAKDSFRCKQRAS